MHTIACTTYACKSESTNPCGWDYPPAVREEKGGIAKTQTHFVSISVIWGVYCYKNILNKRVWHYHRAIRLIPLRVVWAAKTLKMRQMAHYHFWCINFKLWESMSDSANMAESIQCMIIVQHSKVWERRRYKRSFWTKRKIMHCSVGIQAWGRSSCLAGALFSWRN